MTRCVVALLVLIAAIAAAPLYAQDHASPSSTAAQIAQDQTPPPSPPSQDPGPGDYAPGRGIIIAKGSKGEVGLKLWTYVRYLNQLGLDPTYTDAFDRTFSIKRRDDIQNQKVIIGLAGWFGSPKLHYNILVWTSNTSQGDPAQVAVGGTLAYTVGPYLTLAGGTGALPTTRSTQNTFPYWLRVDHRSIADEFFRGSYSTGVWGEGRLGTVKYRLMLANNLSGLGVDAAQLDSGLNTVTAAAWWMPTTGEYGPAEGYGDFQAHEKAATLFGLHYTRSREDAQSQPGTEAIENSQIRLSDGTNLFDANSFFPNFKVQSATYRMLSPDAGIKYRGFSLDGAYFFRWIDDFETVGVAPVTSLFDHGFEVETSAMALPKLLQAYAGYSKIFGQYGKPSDVTAGVNVFPLGTQHFRLNLQAMHVNRSPVGYSAVPYPIGGRGMIYTIDAEFVVF